MSFRLAFTAAPEDIDELGHVNNAVWVRWTQTLATSHWDAVAPPEHRASHVWVVTRHEIDYRGNVAAGETVTGETWVDTPPKGARFDRNVRFVAADGRVVVEAVTTWALLDRASGRLQRVRAEIAAPFLTGGPVGNVGRRNSGPSTSSGRTGGGIATPNSSARSRSR